MIVKVYEAGRNSSLLAEFDVPEASNVLQEAIHAFLTQGLDEMGIDNYHVSFGSEVFATLNVDFVVGDVVEYHFVVT